MSIILRWLRCALCLLAAGVLAAAPLLPRDEITRRLRLASGRGDKQRAVLLTQLFTAAGCPASALTMQRVPHERLPNLICSLPGPDPSTIIVAAHYDHVVEGDGIADNWSGACLLPSLLQSLPASHRHTFVFIAFSGEEDGLVGSQFYVQSLSPADRAAVRAVVDFDTLGLGPTKVWVSHSAAPLVSLAAQVAQQLELPIAGVDVDNVGTTDSQSFTEQHIPTITFHSLTSETLPVLHSIRDNFKVIRLADYYDTYRLLSGYLRAVDAR